MDKKKLLLLGGGSLGIIVIILVIIYGNGIFLKGSLGDPIKISSSLDSDRNEFVIKKPEQKIIEVPKKEQAPVVTPPGSSSGGGFIPPQTEKPVKRTPTASKSFKDVANYKFKEAIYYISNLGIVEGYADGTYRPERTLNRAEMMKITVLAMQHKKPNQISLSELDKYKSGECFKDVPALNETRGIWYSSYVCYGKKLGIIEGYQDGTFRPGNAVTFAEAVKMVLYAFDTKYPKTDPWIDGVLLTAISKKYIPIDSEAAHQSISRGSMAELVYRAIK
jgi:hypothetical protein